MAKREHDTGISVLEGMYDATGAVAIDTDRMAALLASGADPDGRNADGDAALHIAVRAQSFAAVQALLDAGACIDIRGRDLKTPEQLAESMEYDPATPDRDMAFSIKMLLKRRRPKGRGGPGLHPPGGPRF